MAHLKILKKGICTTNVQKLGLTVNFQIKQFYPCSLFDLKIDSGFILMGYLSLMSVLIWDPKTLIR